MGKELLLKITKARITDISDFKIEPEPMITSTNHSQYFNRKHIFTDSMYSIQAIKQQSKRNHLMT